MNTYTLYKCFRTYNVFTAQTKLMAEKGKIDNRPPTQASCRSLVWVSATATIYSLGIYGVHALVLFFLSFLLYTTRITAMLCWRSRIKMLSVLCFISMTFAWFAKEQKCSVGFFPAVFVACAACFLSTRCIRDGWCAKYDVHIRDFVCWRTFLLFLENFLYGFLYPRIVFALGYFYGFFFFFFYEFTLPIHNFLKVLYFFLHSFCFFISSILYWRKEVGNVILIKRLIRCWNEYIDEFAQCHRFYPQLQMIYLIFLVLLTINPVPIIYICWFITSIS